MVGELRLWAVVCVCAGVGKNLRDLILGSCGARGGCWVYAVSRSVRRVTGREGSSLSRALVSYFGLDGIGLIRVVV